MTMNCLEIIISALNLIVVTITAIAIWKTLKSYNKALEISNKALETSNKSLQTNHEWNRRKTTHEILDKFITGEIPDLNSKIVIEFKCKVYDKSITYSTFIKGFNDENIKLKFDDTLVRLLNLFEVLAIDIKNHIIDEDISYDYLSWFITAYNNFSVDFVAKKRQAAGDHRALLNFTNLADKWSIRLKDELNKSNTEGKIKL